MIWPVCQSGYRQTEKMVPGYPVPIFAFLEYVYGSGKIRRGNGDTVAWHHLFTLAGVVRGVAYAGVNIEDLKQIAIPVPPASEQNQIVTQIDTMVYSIKMVSSEAKAR